MSDYSTGIPTSFDLTFFYSESNSLQNAAASISHSDDLEALQVCIAEDIAKKTKKGVVIQYRAWNIADVFRSEGESNIGTASCETCCYQH